MSEAVLLALIQTVPSIAALIGVIYGIRVSLGNRAVVVETKEIAQKTEINTNSMKDALVASTKAASHAEGKEEGRAEGEAKAAVLAKGVLSGEAKK